jgi:hypothetical protein
MLDPNHSTQAMQRRSRARSIAVVVITLQIVASPATASVTDRARAGAMILPPSAVGHHFKRTLLRSYNRREIADQGTWSLAQLDTWGYLIGWEAQYDRGLRTHKNPAQLSSDAGAYRSVSGARRALIANAEACEIGSWHKLSVPRIGMRSVACTEAGSAHGYHGRAFFVAWRCGRFKGAITLTGPDGRFTLGDALPFARRQAVRMSC